MFGLGCALVWIVVPFICVVLYSLIRFVPQEVTQEITYNLKSIPVWSWVIIGLSVIAGFVTGRDFIRWLFKE